MKVKCHKCGSIMDITSLERPLQIKCHVCSTVGVLKAKPLEQKHYVPQVSSTQYSPYTSHPSHAPYPAQHPPYSPYPQPPAWYPEKKKTNVSLAAGILLIIAGILAIGNCIYILAVVGLYPTLSAGESGYFPFFRLCATIQIVLSIFPLLGGVIAVKKTHWGIALAGSSVGLFTIGPFFISSLLSLIALILIAVSKEEFRQQVR